MKVSCPFCQRKSGLFFKTKDRNRRASEENFHYYRCPGCGLIFLSPIPNNLGEFYTADYYPISPTLEQLEAGARQERYKVDLIRQFVPGGNLLEIGPAVGAFALSAKQSGFEVEAIEMDAGCCRVLEEVVGVRAINTNDTKGALSVSGPYNVIALWQVIEHLPDPLETLEAAAARLKPGGVLAIAAPNPAAFQFRVLGRYWTHVDAPRHVFLIPAQTLIERGQRLGLVPVAVTTSDEGAMGWNQFGWEESLVNLTTRARPRRWLRRLGARLTAFFFSVERRGLLGSSYTIIFRKGEAG